ncbi:arsenosugar biosynthesis radical SAM (seleno)protein ArsS [Nitrospira sp. M1]
MIREIPLSQPTTVPLQNTHMASFDETIASHGIPCLTASTITSLQVNIGKVCNQTCHHCHVDAGPQRTEIMTVDTMDMVLSALKRYPQITMVDITGGAPEMNPHFEYFVTECRKLDRKVIDRCNLTVFFVKGKGHLPQFLAEHHVEIIASLPCYIEDNVDEQRGKGVFDRSITALQQLNTLGYGREGSNLHLHLVYNPLGPNLPPSQTELEVDYKKELMSRFGIAFNNLYTITNMPIRRFLDELEANGQTDQYLELLVNSFNPTSIPGLMCRSLISIGWDGILYDCDFNQMLNLTTHPSSPTTIANFDIRTLEHRPIMTGTHCYGCTAGSGSSCGGSLTGEKNVSRDSYLV